jgi:hypothetical protein
MEIPPINFILSAFYRNDALESAYFILKVTVPNLEMHFFVMFSITNGGICALRYCTKIYNRF